MKQERRLEDMIAELHEAVERLPKATLPAKQLTLHEAAMQASQAITAFGIALGEMMQPVIKAFNELPLSIEPTRWQKIKDKVMRR